MKNDNFCVRVPAGAGTVAVDIQKLPQYDGKPMPEIRVVLEPECALHFARDLIIAALKSAGRQLHFFRVFPKVIDKNNNDL